ncbi:MAG TPA: prolyl oligopeptidase family serine peptidase [Burkholderiaceae bacterium]|nr:prolyl oligopeptidase family serine peptidase [Burkholderiaceae bacterium]
MHVFYPPLRAARFALVALVLAGTAGAAEIEYPEAPKRPVTDMYHGVSVVDDYRWLEDDNAPEVKAWVAAQNALTRKVIDGIAQRPEISRRLAQLLGERAATRFAMRYRGGRLFALKSAPPKNQPVLVVLPASLDVKRETLVLDPARIDPSGRTTIDFFTPSFDGRLVAVSLSKDGTEDGTAYVYDVSTGRRLPDEIPRVTYPTGGGSIEWAADSKGFFYTRYPQAGEVPQSDGAFHMQIWFHRLGTPLAKDRYVIGREFPRIAEVALEASRDGLFLLAEVRNGDGGEIAYHLRNTAGKWARVADFGDEVKQAKFGEDGRLYLLSVQDAPLGRVLAVPLADPRLARARVVVDEHALAADQIAASRSRLFVRYRDGGPSRARVFGLDGKPLGEIGTEKIGDVDLGEVLDRDRLLLRTMSYVSPPLHQLFDARTQQLVVTALSARPAFDFDDATIDTGFATSPDGTHVPVTVLHRKDMKLDGRNPVLLYGYGGYGISMVPYFSGLNRLWLDYGGVYAVVGTRGGGEYGEPWHRAGMLTRKQNVFDDFAAAMRYLVENDYTRPERLAIMGGSNGGLTMGAALTQQPQAMRAVVSQVGIYDSLRWETQPNGEYNVTEFGSVQDPDQFKALYDYSPLLRVRDGVAYPAVLLTTGDNDGRVAPYESRKMAARLQAATAARHPVLLRTDAGAGHGMGTPLSAALELEADIFAFLVDQLDMESPARTGGATTARQP